MSTCTHPQRNRTEPAGFALIAVLVALAILLALLTPFMIVMSNEAEVGRSEVADKRAELLSLGHVTWFLDLVTQTDLGVDTTPFADTLSEFPGRLALPDVFRSRIRKHQELVSGEVVDLQRKVNLNTVSPLMLANLLGLSASLREEVAPDGGTITVDSPGNFPAENGTLIVDGEVIRYERRDGNSFEGLTRNVLGDPAYVDYTLRQDVLVLDYRCVLVATATFDEASATKRNLHTPYSDVNHLGRIKKSGFGTFTQAEMDVLRKHGTTDSVIELSERWGKPQRVFNTLEAGVSKTLRVKSGLGLGAGTVVRIKARNSETSEYALVYKTTFARGRAGSTSNLQPAWQLQLLRPVVNSYDPLETEVLPLVRHPININTADTEVLQASMLNLRRAPQHAHNPEQQGGRSAFGPKITPQYAKTVADRILALRAGTQQDGGEASSGLNSWEGLVGGILAPLAEEAASDQEKRLILLLLQNWMTGRTPVAEMATLPISFTSASVVAYRVASMQNRFSGLEAARRERRGVASVTPRQALDYLVATQEFWEETYRLNRQSPGWASYPFNVGGIHPHGLGNDPSDRSLPYLRTRIWSNTAWNRPKYPNRDLADVGMKPQTAITRPFGQAYRKHDSFLHSDNPEGWDVDKVGHYEVLNSGPRAESGGPQRGRETHEQIEFDFTGRAGMPQRHAIHFWARPRTHRDQALFELASDLRERNMISVRIEEAHIVFEVLDEAGLDPTPQATRTQPERTAAQWRVPITELNLPEDVPFHLNFAADGNRPDQLSLLIDGVPRQEARFRTYLTQEIGEWERPENSLPHDPGNKEQYLQIRVEDTEHFPDQGVLRIGRELFEYTSKDANTFHCKLVDSMGGRRARMRWYEFRDDLEVDNRGRPTKSERDLNQAVREKAPSHPEGSAVELYGYASPIYRNLPVTSGGAKLADKLGSFAVARGFKRNPEPIVIPVPRGAPLRIGTGLLEDTKDEIELADPLPNASGKSYPPDKAESRITEGFPESGGYALLVQRQFRIRSTQPNVFGEILVGGVELIKYGRRKSHTLSGIERAVTVGNFPRANSRGPFDGKPHFFVMDWEGAFLRTGGSNVPLNELPGYVLYVVPVSISVNGTVTDPTVLGWTEWAQIYPKDDETKTEWVRYDQFVEGKHLVRAQANAYRRVHSQITGQRARGLAGVNRGGVTINNPGVRMAYNPPPATLLGIKRIGFIEKLENDFPVIYQARLALGFRGDTFTGTTPHEHAAGTMVLPTVRVELDRGSYGGLSARVGRNDRVAFVGGNQAKGESRPPLEWHSVNWYCQRHGFDNRNAGQNAELLGPFPFQLIGLKDEIKDTFVGPGRRDDFRDTRQVDRIVKFPSGELPAAYVDHARFGGSDEYPQMQGILDEVSPVMRVSDPLVLAQSIDDAAKTFTVHQHVRLYAYGSVTTAQDLTRTSPNYGGLVMIDGEIIAYQNHGGGVFKVANNGRGMLGTEARAHARGARVHFLGHVPAAILSAALGESSHELVVQNLGAMPRYGGTVLLNRELLHYTWTVGNQMMEMPIWRDPDSQDQEATEGLFRGRYGTVPESAGAGDAVVWFPIRYWDRFHERAEDPEMHHVQVTLNQNSVFYASIGWEEENPDSQFMNVQCYVRVDGLAAFSADPDKERMLFRFKDAKVNEKPNPIGRQGSVLEARFVTEYKPGAFEAETFLQHAWKLAPVVRRCTISYEGETRILKETVTQR